MRAGQRLREGRDLHDGGVSEVEMKVAGVGPGGRQCRGGGVQVTAERGQVRARHQHRDQQRAAGGEAARERGAEAEAVAHAGGRPLR
jgi:hypothetical protein